jgi:hypothetical protein
VSFTAYDFVESLDRVDIKPSFVEHVLAAWGRSPEGYGSWEGGFLFRLRDGRFAYVSGWADTSGWGCQDGAQVQHFATEPSIGELRSEGMSEPSAGEWDVAPADLNGWLERGAVAGDLFA